MAKRAAGGMKEAGVGAGGRARAPRCVAARTSHISSWEGCARRSRFVYRFFGSGLRVYTYFLDGVAAPLFAGAPRLAPARPPHRSPFPFRLLLFTRLDLATDF